ncbi:MAG: vWA domain-containing protein [Desulfatiglandales bacterium]
MPKKCVLMCLAAALLVFGFTLTASAATYPEVMFLLDASGSMWGRAKGKTKIEIAREVMGRIVPSLPAEVKVGLTVYGHRKKGDCSDIEVVVEPGSDDRMRVVDTVNAINPKGMTPIADSITMVVDKLKGREAETTIILVSDGEETCHDDPCGVVKALKESGIRFILHVVGFDVTAGQRAQLQCLSDAAGGTYFDAGDADSLLAALTTVTREVEEKVEKARVTTKKEVSRLGRLHITFPGEGKSIRAFTIIRAGDGKVVKTVEDPKNDSTHPLLAGDYQIVAGFANPNYKPNTDVPLGTWSVVGGEVAQCALGTVAFNVADGLKSMPVNSITLEEKNTGTPSITLECGKNDYYLFKPKPVVPGTYTVSLNYHQSKGPTILVDDLEVEAGSTAYVTVDSGITLVQPAEASVEAWALFSAGRDTPIIDVTRRWDNQEPLWRVFAVPAGTYNLMIKLKGMDEPLPAGEGIEIKQGELVKFDAGL